MGADFIVHFECSTKKQFGDGDALEGTGRLLAMLKAKSRAEVLREAAAETGQTTITIVRVTPEGQREEEISLDALHSAAAPLAEHQALCQGCDANVLGASYGCVGFVPYPVRAEWEAALVGRLQLVEAPGGFLLASAVKDFHYDGEGIKRMRAAGMFEAKTAPTKVIQKKLFGSVKVSGDQLFHALFSVGSQLNPDHCGMVLAFVGALAVNGRVPASHTEAIAFQESLAKRSATLVLEGDPEGPLNTLLRALFRAWKLDVPLLMDA
jgi:hypothetical protein